MNYNFAIALGFSFTAIGIGFFLGSFATDLSERSPTDWRYTKSDLYWVVEDLIEDREEGIFYVTDNCHVELRNYDSSWEDVPSMLSTCEKTDEVTLTWLSDAYHEVTGKIIDEQRNKGNMES